MPRTRLRGGRLQPNPAGDTWIDLTVADRIRIFNQYVADINQLVDRVMVDHNIHDRMAAGPSKRAMARRVKAQYRRLKDLERLKRNLFPHGPMV